MGEGLAAGGVEMVDAEEGVEEEEEAEKEDDEGPKTTEEITSRIALVLLQA
jgi:hypothetical protein